VFHAFVPMRMQGRGRLPSISLPVWPISAILSTFGALPGLLSRGFAAGLALTIVGAVPSGVQSGVTRCIAETHAVAAIQPRREGAEWGCR
jgi:hypothetical protein